MANRLPVQFVAEFRGLSPASEFKSRESGERVDIPPKLKFEVEVGQGDDVELIVLSQTALDRAKAEFPIGSLRRGDRLQLSGVVVLQDRGSDRDSYFSVLEVQLLIDPPAKAPAAAVKS
jgi:hypothetical protein